MAITSTALLALNASADHGDWNPRPYVGHYGLVARLRNRDAEEPDEVTVGFEDGHTEMFTEYGGDLEFGYPAPHQNEAWVEGWHGPIEYIEARNGNAVVRAEYDDDEDVPSVDCGTWDFGWSTDLRVDLEDAHKWYDGPTGDTGVFGSPGREIQSVYEVGLYYVEFDGQSCDSSDRAVTFDCTSVTVDPEEFVSGNEEIWNPRLDFADGEQQQLFDDWDEMYEPPVTFEGEDEHEGKVIERLRFDNDSGGEVMFRYSNPNVVSCEPGSSDDNGTGGNGNDDDGNGGNGNDDDGDSNGNGSDDSTPASSDDDPNGSTSTSSDDDGGATTTGGGGGSTGGSSSTPTDDTSSTTTSTETTTDTPTSDDGGTIESGVEQMTSDNTEEQSGFGAIAGVAGFGGFAYLVNRFRETEGTDK